MDPRVSIYESRKVLEINPTNNLVKRMNVAVQQVESDEVEGFEEEEDEGGTEENQQKLSENKQKLETMAWLLYDTAIFESGYIIGDSNEYAERVFDVLTRMTGLPNAPVEGCYI
jgi:HSP90 family molecular chaperone